MPIAVQDQRVLEALATACTEYHELSSLLDFYLDLYSFQYQAKADLPEPQVGDDGVMQHRLEAGLPQVTLDQLGLEAGPFAKLVVEVGGLLASGNPSWLVEVLDRAPTDLLALAQEVFDTWDTLTAPGANLPPEAENERGFDRMTTLAVGFALAPYLQRASDAILPRLDLGRWALGTCPICGGRPNFALLDAENGARSLMCSRCDSLWPFSRILCPFCTSETRSVYHPSEDGLHRLYVCSACKGYLKVVDLRRARQAVYPAVERLLTVGMDLAAAKEGYRG